MFILQEAPYVFIAGELPFIVVDVGFNSLPPCVFIRQLRNKRTKVINGVLMQETFKVAQADDLVSWTPPFFW